MQALSFFPDGNQLKIALIRKNKEEICIELAKTLPLDADVKPLYILGPEQSPLIATALDPSATLFRILHLPIRDPRKVRATLPFQIETLLPFSAEETVLAPILKKVGKHATTVLLFATKESHLSEHLIWAETLGVDPDHVTCAPLALYRIAKWLAPQEKELCLFYRGEENSFCLCLQGGEIALSQTLYFGRSQDREASQELSRLKNFLTKKQALHETSRWMVFGQELSSSGFLNLFSGVFSSPILPLPSREIEEYAIPIGIALNSLSSDDHALQLRQQIWTPKHLLKKRKRFAALYASLCVALTAFLLYGTHLTCTKKLSLLTEKLEQLLPSNLSKEHLASIEEIELKIWEWEKSLNSQKLSFPFISTAPTVSDLLAWLSTHPVLSDSDGGKKSDLEVQSLRYQLYKYPKLGESKDPYLARVDLEFTTSSPRLAREFHDALLKGDLLVNGKKEIKWVAQNGTYFTSFELLPLQKGGTL